MKKQQHLRGRVVARLTPRERIVYRLVLSKLRAGVARTELTEDELAVLRRYDRIRKQLKREELVDRRFNPRYRRWLLDHGYPLQPYSQRLYMKWYREQRRQLLEAM